MSIIQLINNFNNLQQSQESCIFILRHAEKQLADNIYDDITITLTELGVKSSKQLGQQLAEFYPQIEIVRTSFILRCLETAKHMFSVYPAKVSIISDSVLGGDGAYVADNILAAEHFKMLPNRKDIFIEMQLGKKFAGMSDLEGGTNILLNKIAYDLDNTSRPGFYITHDCILALFVNSMTDIIVDDKNWFQYLDGICIKRIKNDIFLYWGKSEFNVTNKFNIILGPKNIDTSCITRCIFE